MMDCTSPVMIVTRVSFFLFFFFFFLLLLFCILCVNAEESSYKRGYKAVPEPEWNYS